MELFKKPSIEIIAYTAGFFDGDGSISFNTRTNVHKCCLMQSEKNNGKEVVEWFREQWGFGGIDCRDYLKRDKKGKIAKGKTTWWGQDYRLYSWRIERVNEVKFFLNAIMPYLFVKTKKAKRALEFLNNKTKHANMGDWYPIEMQYLQRNWRKLNDKELAKKLNRTENAIRAKRGSLKFFRDN